jgi:acyl carrier protein
MPDAEKFISEVSKIAQKDKDLITLDTKLQDLNWDSLCTLEFIAVLDSDYGRVASSEQLRDAKSVGDLFRFIE